jgi:hypothetical protein
MALIFDSIPGGKIFNEDGTIDMIVYNNSGATRGIGDWCNWNVKKLEAAESDAGMFNYIGYVTTATSTNVKFSRKGFFLTKTANGDPGKIRIYGLHTSANIATGSTTLANYAAFGTDATVTRTSYVGHVAYCSNQGVGSSANICGGYVVSATSKAVFVQGL